MGRLLGSGEWTLAHAAGRFVDRVGLGRWAFWEIRVKQGIGPSSYTAFPDTSSPVIVLPSTSLPNYDSHHTQTFIAAPLFPLHITTHTG
jgi:hypothetical protein